MKLRIHTILIILLWFPSVLIHGQITITSSDMPDINDTVRLSNALTAGSIDFTLTGTNHTWDFSSLVPVSQRIDTFVSVLSTPIMYYPSFVLHASYGIKGNEFSMLGFDLKDVYDYYKKTTTKYQNVGFAATVNGIPFPVRYNDYDVLFRFPMTYGNIDSSEASFAMQIPMLGYYSNEKKRHNHVDGWGTLITPYGTFQTIRVKSMVTNTDSIFIDSLGTGMPPVTTHYTEYKWLANGFPVPMLTIVDRVVGDEFFYIDSNRNIGNNTIHTVTANNTLTIYPNPAKNSIVLNFSQKITGDIVVALFTTTGKKVYSNTFSGSVDNIAISNKEYNISPGIYMLIVKTKTFTHKSKIVFQH